MIIKGRSVAWKFNVWRGRVLSMHARTHIETKTQCPLLLRAIMSVGGGVKLASWLELNQV